MEGQLREFAERKRFATEKRFIYGMVDDVYVTITPMGNTLQLYLGMSCPVARAEDGIKQAVKPLRGVRVSRIMQRGEAIIVMIVKNRAALKPDNLDAVIRFSITAARAANAVPNVTCVHCGKQTDNIAIFQDVVSPVCPDCMENIENDNKTYTASPLSYITGIIGALLGGLIGSIPWLIVLHMGWIISLLAFLIALGSYYGYRLFRGPRKRGYASAVIYASSIICAVASFVIYLYILLAIALSFAPPVGLFLTALPEILSDALSDADVIKALLIAFVFAVAGVIGIHKQISTYTLPKNARSLGKRSAPVPPQYDEPHGEQ